MSPNLGGTPHPGGGYGISKAKGGELEMSLTQLNFGSRSEMVKIKMLLCVFQCTLMVYASTLRYIPVTQHSNWCFYSCLDDFCLGALMQPPLHFFLAI